MKTFCLTSSFVLFLSYFSFSQDSTAQIAITPQLPGSELLIIDSLKHFRSPELFPVTVKASYLQIYKDYAYLTFASRLCSDFASGKIYNPMIREYEMDTLNVFTIITDNQYANSVSGRRVFIGISKDFDTNHNLYFLNQMKQVEYVAKAHYASEEEIKWLKSMQ